MAGPCHLQSSIHHLHGQPAALQPPRVCWPWPGTCRVFPAAPRGCTQVFPPSHIPRGQGSTASSCAVSLAACPALCADCSVQIAALTFLTVSHQQLFVGVRGNGALLAPKCPLCHFLCVTSVSGAIPSLRMSLSLQAGRAKAEAALH